ncbi:translational GTPase TypA [Marinihelvus fidelis]|uniref:Large ribosomal subunit assembly factor BipA n=1 Tax=Marinihelvus fidelis TaxID=2613842 RepID=A0A5N0T9X2_9GAMM|nr:translational GTPase TypA [Marinihelvus fidelis]KAA9131815.1 translational GTPase TypA [Marinihelvus fidelis]
MIENLRNIAIIAHVDHGKTTLVDQLLQQSGTLGDRAAAPERVMDSNELEKERGITILSKNTAITWKDDDTTWRINIVDTPGHADFGGEVERILSMVDSVLLLVDAVDGPMPQTRFVTQKAFEMGFKPIVVINKIDRDGARPDWVLDQTFELFDQLGATDEQLDFPVVYASALRGYASEENSARDGDMTPLFRTIVEQVSPPDVDTEGPFQMRITTLDYNTYVGVIGVGRVQRGTVKPNQRVTVIDRDGESRSAKVLQVLGFHGLDRIEVESANAGDIIALTGIEGLRISDTICDREAPEALPVLSVDEPTISMTFRVNSSPFAGREGKFLTSRQIRERLLREASHNVALRIEETEDPEKFRVSGRGELHLSILIETMRREGYELAISRPEVILKQIDGKTQEPYESLVVDLEDSYQGAVMEKLGERRGVLQDMQPDGKGRIRMDYLIPARGLIGFQSEFRTLTAGTGLLFHVFDHYGPYNPAPISTRNNGVLISNATGKSVAYALFNLQERGRMIIEGGVDVYEGQVIGVHNRGNDLTVNPLKAKQLTNIRTQMKDDATTLSAHQELTLEQALEFIQDDELVEATPENIRIRKKHLLEHERRVAERNAKRAEEA